MMLRYLHKCQRGSGTVEFSMIAPVLITLMVGAMNVGSYFFAQNSIDYAVDKTAREAAVYPFKSDSELETIFDDAILKKEADGAVTLGLSHGTASNGVGYVDLSTSYKVPVNMIFFNLGSITVRSERRVYQAADD